MMTRGHDIAMGLRAAYWAVHRRTDADLERHGVTAHQFVLLSLLSEADGITQQELVRRASSDANTVRAMLVLLERGGLLSRRPHPTDGRARQVVLTPKGRRRSAGCGKPARPSGSGWPGFLTRRTGMALVAALRRVAEAMSPPLPGRRTTTRRRISARAQL